MEKINVAELLKDCPKGMELDCSIFTIPVNYYNNSEDCDYPLSIITKNGEIFRLTKEGCLYNKVDAKCVIFPKGKTSWEGFVPPCQFKDGDIVCTAMDSIAILGNRIGEHSAGFHTYCGLFNYEFDFDVIVSPERLATEEEKQKLFDTIKANGYTWNEETKTLEKLVEPKFKSGDILYCDANDDGEDKDRFKYIFIFDKIVDVDGTQFYYSHCHLFGSEFYTTETNLVSDYPVRFATEKEKQKLFQAIKDNGYKWNPETKTLEKLLKPKFKVRDRIKQIGSPRCYIIQAIEFDRYKLHNGQFLKFGDEHMYELVPKFDINILVPFESRVLVRDNKLQKWSPAIWGFYDSESEDYKYKLVGTIARYCIPYKGNEHLIGKTDDCDDYYKTWK